MRRVVLTCFLFAVTPLLLGGCPKVPDRNSPWLSFKYANDCGIDNPCFVEMLDADAARSYYLGLGIADPDNYTFDMWLSDSGYSSGSTFARAIYGNLADLQFGRDMQCAQSGQRTICYVLNFGHTPLRAGIDGLPETNPAWPNITFAVSEAIRPSSPIGIVAMIDDPSKNPNRVSFYAFGTKIVGYDEFGTPTTRDNALLSLVALDQEGEKSVPRMCMACHGGTYDRNSNTASGAVFLPFDVFSFRYPDATGYSFDEQQEELRKLNAFVAATGPGQPILDLINGLYPSGVANAGSTASDGWVPPGWLDNSSLYTSVVKPYCRTCHVAQPVPFTSYSDFEALIERLQQAVCEKHSMPHAQIPYGLDGKEIGFWNDRVAQEDLRSFFKGQGVNDCPPTD
jgi:hypothetical protein